MRIRAMHEEQRVWNLSRSLSMSLVGWGMKGTHCGSVLLKSQQGPASMMLSFCPLTYKQRKQFLIDRLLWVTFSYFLPLT